MRKALNAALVAVALVTFSCGGAKPAPSPQDRSPAWLSQGSGAFDDENGKRLQGVASSSGQDPRERRKDADARAREELGRTMDAFAASLAKTSAAQDDAAGAAALARKASAAARIADHWVAPDGTESAVCVLTLQGFKSGLQRADGDDQLKARLTSEADRFFAQLAKP